MLLRWDPFREFDRLTEQAMGTPSQVARFIPIDAYRRGEQFFVHLDVPGVDPASIELTVDKNVLTVKAERTWERKDGDEVLIAERPRGSFSRQLFLGDTLDADHIEAHYDQGVLTVTVPVAEKAKARRIEVGTGAAPEAKTIEATSTAA